MNRWIMCVYKEQMSLIGYVGVNTFQFRKALD